jgi:Fic family protein
MRRQDLSVSRQRTLVKCDEPRTHCHALVPSKTPRLLPSSVRVGPAMTRAHEALGRLQDAISHLPNTDLITRSLARREAVQSSQIEGTRTQLCELLEYEATQGEEGRSPDAQITERYVIALNDGLTSLNSSGAEGLTLAVVKRLHSILMECDHRHIRPGQWRDTQAWIGAGRIEDATFVPPPPAYIDACMRELEDSMLRYERREDEHYEIGIVARLAITHAQFETIHPFADGNGRVGRLLTPLMLSEAKYPPLYLSGFMLKHRHAYYGSLAGVQLKDQWDAWVEFLCNAVVDACDTSLSIARDMNAILDTWLARLTDIRIDALTHRLPTLLLGHPVTSVREVASLLQTSLPTASKAVETLVERGILHDRYPERKRKRILYAPELLARLERN